MAKKWLAVDFDETVACGEREVPLAVESLVRLQAAGWRLILLTMREGVGLEMALRWCEARGLHFDAVNECPDFQRSRKVFAHVSVDDRAVGCPTRRFRGKDVVDWEGVLAQLRGR
ncbi:hypothetical protein [Bilophila wadsworthia]|uniref:hypothetical protein n=1 Tax=Bilophila wadsworthia TaxID=35833 RepID=UPI00325FE084